MKKEARLVFTSTNKHPITASVQRLPWLPPGLLTGYLLTGPSCGSVVAVSLQRHLAFIQSDVQQQQKDVEEKQQDSGLRTVGVQQDTETEC